MKELIPLVILLITSTISLSQKIKKDDLVGEWTFIELQNDSGEKVTEIKHEGLKKRTGFNGVEKVNRDNYVLNGDGTYQSSNPLNESVGTWYYDEKNNAIRLEFRIAPDDKYIEIAKKMKTIKKRKDGFYYQKPTTEKILYFSKDSIVMDDYVGYYRIYTRKK
ncbi:conserved hypothetical protein [Zunongwangia profunda SM-A87]|uniref:Uncharacterized protein n=1 Tax=Zunongwangia profunda (strain DSM 18752 / CCTCC AB 206139 / SM-A87) TaxID=655815 RepID=D5B9S5_ZUNPS|nr:glycoside hydrolase family 43 C-terminal domain-containing protein [Zunongwangia profunda]ADF54388.1 conserved hypothetical protein [Zunongwangia profunda SM-A87]